MRSSASTTRPAARPGSRRRRSRCRPSSTWSRAGSAWPGCRRRQSGAWVVCAQRAGEFGAAGVVDQPRSARLRDQPASGRRRSASTPQPCTARCEIQPRSEPRPAPARCRRSHGFDAHVAPASEWRRTLCGTHGTIAAMLMYPQIDPVALQLGPDRHPLVRPDLPGRLRRCSSCSARAGCGTSRSARSPGRAPGRARTSKTCCSSACWA